ncbi:MAG TPA: amidase family protein, partial [Gammaproteobacteria bacterium]
MFHTKTIAELSAMLDKGDASSVEITQAFLQRIKKFDPELNSFITVTEEQALAQAKAADDQRKAGTATALTGIPLAQKDIFCTLN